MKISEQLQELEQLLIEKQKHLPDKHPQKSHGGGRGGGKGTSGITIPASVDRKINKLALVHNLNVAHSSSGLRTSVSAKKPSTNMNKAYQDFKKQLDGTKVEGATVKVTEPKDNKMNIWIL